MSTLNNQAKIKGFFNLEYSTQDMNKIMAIRNSVISISSTSLWEPHARNGNIIYYKTSETVEDITFPIHKTHMRLNKLSNRLGLSNNLCGIYHAARTDYNAGLMDAIEKANLYPSMRECTTTVTREVPVELIPPTTVCSIDAVRLGSALPYSSRCQIDYDGDSYIPDSLARILSPSVKQDKLKYSKTNKWLRK